MWFPGDPNGDGKTDLMQVIREPDDQHAALRTWLYDPGQGYFNPTRVYSTDLLFYMPRLSSSGSTCLDAWKPTIWFPGDADGDGHTDFIQAFRKHNYGCPLSGDDKRLDVAVAYTRSSGDYKFSTTETSRRWRPSHAVNLFPTM